MKSSIILTTIFEPNDVVYKLSDLAKSSNTTLVIAGDKKLKLRVIGILNIM